MEDEILTPPEYWRLEAKPAERVPYLSVADLAVRLHVSEAQIRRWARKGRIPHHKVDNRVLFLWWEIEPCIPRIWHLIGRPMAIRTSGKSGI